MSSQPSHAAVLTWTLTNKMSDQARSRGKNAYSRAALISQRRGRRAGRSDAHIASSRPPGVTRRVEEQGVCSTCVSGHVRQFSSSVRERQQLAPYVPRVGCSKQQFPLLFRCQVSPDCRCSTSRRDLVCEHWIHGTVKEARNVLFASSTAGEKSYDVELAEMTADDSVELEVGPSSHKAQEPLDSLECALMSVLMKRKGFFAARQPER